MIIIVAVFMIILILLCIATLGLVSTTWQLIIIFSSGITLISILRNERFKKILDNIIKRIYDEA